MAKANDGDIKLDSLDKVIFTDANGTEHKIQWDDGTGGFDMDDRGQSVMLSDTSTSSMLFVVDEDTMVSDSNTKVPTQQSVKAYTESYADGITKTFEQVVDDNLVGSTYSTLNDLMNTTQSSGRISGGTVVYNDGTETVSVSAGTGLIRDTDDEIGNIKFFDWDGDSSVSIVSGETNWIYVDYNTGTPLVSATDDWINLNHNTNFVIGRVYKQIDGNHIHYLGAGDELPNVRHKLLKYLHETKGAEYSAGLLISESGTLNLDITSGAFYTSLIKNTILSFDSSGTDTFTYWSTAVSGGFQEYRDISAIDNTQYDNGITPLTALSPDKFKTDWVYVTFDGTVHVQYGQDEYDSLVLAESEEIPQPPPFLNDFALFCGRIITREGVDSFTTVASAFITAFEIGHVNDHNELAGLQGGFVNQYYHLKSAELSKLTNIESLADVTDTTNVEAAGAVMESDATTASMSFVIDEDTMASNLNTKVPTQQSVKTYVDNRTLADIGYNGETDATADQTASEILTLLKTVDGADSLLDADLLDSQEGSYYQDATNLNAGTVADVRLSTNVPLKDADNTFSGSNTFTDTNTISAIEAQLVFTETVSGNTSRIIQSGDTLSIEVSGSDVIVSDYDGANLQGDLYVHKSDLDNLVWHEGNMGTGSGLDADLLDSAHKSTDVTLATNSDLLIPTEKAVKTYVDGRVVSSLRYRGGYDADTNTPDLDTSPTGVVIGDMYTVTVSGSFFDTIDLEVGDVLISEADDATLLDQWTIVNKDLDSVGIKTAYESNPDTNEYSDAEKTQVGLTTGTNTGDEVPATLTVAGVIELATQTEVDEGTDSVRAVTPSTLASAIQSASIVIVREEYTATASQTIFTTVQPYTVGGNDISVYINGIRQFGGAYTETDSYTITFTGALDLNDSVFFEFITT
jgi:hypothetical protein